MHALRTTRRLAAPWSNAIHRRPDAHYYRCIHGWVSPQLFMFTSDGCTHTQPAYLPTIQLPTQRAFEASIGAQQLLSARAAQPPSERSAQLQSSLS